MGLDAVPCVRKGTASTQGVSAALHTRHLRQHARNAASYFLFKRKAEERGRLQQRVPEAGGSSVLGSLGARPAAGHGGRREAVGQGAELLGQLAQGPARGRGGGAGLPGAQVSRLLLPVWDTG